MERFSCCCCPSDPGWSLMEVLVFKRANSASTSYPVCGEEDGMACFSFANRSLRSICWGSLDLPVQMAGWLAGGQRRNVAGSSCVSGLSGHQCRAAQSGLLWPESLLWAQIFPHQLLYQRYGVPSSWGVGGYPALLNECYSIILKIMFNDLWFPGTLTNQLSWAHLRERREATGPDLQARPS